MPRSITIFSALYLGSLVLGVIIDWYYFDALMASVANDPEMEFDEETLELMETALAAAFFVMHAFMFILWALVTSLRSRIAKWVIVIIAALSCLGLVADPGMYGAVELALRSCANALLIASIVFLFRQDARDWLAGRKKVDVTVFE